MEAPAKRQRRRGLVKVLSEATVAEVKRWNNCKQTISLKILAGKFVWDFCGDSRSKRGVFRAIQVHLGDF
jgi:hypothetical protein